jgi:hypothetical protein
VVEAHWVSSLKNACSGAWATVGLISTSSAMTIVTALIGVRGARCPPGRTRPPPLVIAFFNLVPPKASTMEVEPAPGPEVERETGLGGREVLRHLHTGRRQAEWPSCALSGPVRFHFTP